MREKCAAKEMDVMVVLDRIQDLTQALQKDLVNKQVYVSCTQVKEIAVVLSGYASVLSGISGYFGNDYDIQPKD